FIASIQILAAEFSAGREAKLFKIFPRILKFWPRVAMLCIFVYGVFFLLTVFGFGIAVMIIAGGSSFLVPFLALALLGLQVWMFGRFFINVLFWQQFAVLADADPANALRQSTARPPPPPRRGRGPPGPAGRSPIPWPTPRRCQPRRRGGSGRGSAPRGSRPAGG